MCCVVAHLWDLGREHLGAEQPTANCEPAAVRRARAQHRAVSAVAGAYAWLFCAADRDGHLVGFSGETALKRTGSIQNRHRPVGLGVKSSAALLSRQNFGRCRAEQVRERVRRQTGNAGLASRMVPEVPNEALLLSRAALLRESLGQRFDIQANLSFCLSMPPTHCRLACTAWFVACTTDAFLFLDRTRNDPFLTMLDRRALHRAAPLHARQHL